MIRTIEFGKLKAMMIDYVNQGSDGCYFLRMVGDEPTVNAIWARLSSREARGKPWSSGIEITLPGRNYPEYVALMKGITYKTIPDPTAQRDDRPGPASSPADPGRG